MEVKINREQLIQDMKQLIETQSVVSFYELIHPVIEARAKQLGYTVTYDRKHTAYIKVAGSDHSKCVCVGAHLDTIGLMVRRIQSDGTLAVRQLGGVNYASLEGESVTIHTRDNKVYTGMVICKSHSVHVFDDARTLARDEQGMQVILDHFVASEQDVLDLGIQHGDVICIEPRFQYTQEGFVRSRFIDDKAAVAAVFACLDVMKQQDLTPKYDTLFAFPIFEEIGHGGAYVPPEVSEYVALDIGLIGPDYHGSETKVSICAADNYSPYDRALTNRIIDLAKKADIDYCVDIFYRYGTDANAAIRSGNNIYAAAFGMGCMNTHGMERCHITAIEQTAKLTLFYIMDWQ